jgi:hypothetical protein
MLDPLVRVRSDKTSGVLILKLRIVSRVARKIRRPKSRQVRREVLTERLQELADARINAWTHATCLKMAERPP